MGTRNIGCRGLGENCRLGHLKLDWLRQCRAGIPKHDTMEGVIGRLKTNKIASAFQSWISSLIKKTGCDVIAIRVKLHDVHFQRQIVKKHFILSLSASISFRVNSG